MVVSCCQKSFIKINNDKRQEIHNQLWKIPNKDEKWNFIAHHVKYKNMENSKKSNFNYSTISQLKEKKSKFVKQCFLKLWTFAIGGLKLVYAKRITVELYLLIDYEKILDV